MEGDFFSRSAVTSYFVGFVKMDFEKCLGSNLTCERGRNEKIVARGLPRVSKHLFLLCILVQFDEIFYKVKKKRKKKSVKLVRRYIDIIPLRL